MRKLFVFILALTVVMSAFTALTVLHAAALEADIDFTPSEIKNTNNWTKNGTVNLTKNGDDDVVRFVPTANASNGYGITVDIPVDDAQFVVIKYETNLYVNSFQLSYAMKSNFDFNYQYGNTRRSHDPSKNILIFNMTTAIANAKEAGETSIKYVKFIPWDGQTITFDGNLSDQYFDIYSVAFFDNADDANRYAAELDGYSFIDYDTLPKSDALYLSEDLNNAFAWVKHGYRAYIPGAYNGPFKYVTSGFLSNGIGFKVSVPAAKAKYVVVRYYTNVVANSFRIAYSHTDAFDYNYQYGISSVTNVKDKRVALFDMTNVVKAANNAGVSTIEYLKFLPWEGQAWTGDANVAKNYFNLYSVAFFESKSEAEAYKAALEAALPSLDVEKRYDNTNVAALPGANVDATELRKMISAFKEKEKNFASSPNKLIIYPEYPERIGRDYDYSVKVSQGGEAYSIPVYNELRQGGGTRNNYGDNHRRFCEFAFSGEPVRIDVTVNMSFSEYTVIPASKNIPSEVNGNVISLYVSEPMQLILRLGNGLESNNTNLAIFVDPPEENVPDKNDDDVIYIEGWYEEDDNELNVTEGQTVYIAPGAVCNARVLATGDNITITGRGMVRDPHDTRSFNKHSYNYNVNIKKGSNILVEGIKIVDCRFYHLYMNGVTNSEIYNVKIFSNQISTDGFLISGTNIYIHDSYADVGDDTFTGSGTNKYYEDMLVGSTCGIFSLSGVRSNEVYKDINIFRADEAIFKNYYGSGAFLGATFENIYSVDCPFTPFLLSSRDQGDGMKNFVFKNVSLKAPSGVGDKNTPFNKYKGTVLDIQNGDNFRFDFENLYIDGSLITSPSQVKIADRSSSAAYVNVTVDDEIQTDIPLETNTTVLDTPYVAPPKPVKPLYNNENIVPNGDFEDGASPWVCVDFSYIYLTDDAVSGENSMYIPASTSSEGTDQRGGITAYITDEINRGGAGEYLVEFYAKKAPGFEGEYINAVLGYYYGDVTETESMTYKSPAKRFTLTEEWQKFSYVATVEVDEVQRAALSIHRGSAALFLPLDFYLDDISITKLGAPDPVCGDVNTDGKVDRKDLSRLAQYFARWDVEINTVASDANGDGKVDRKDLTRLAQYFARWDVELGK